MDCGDIMLNLCLGNEIEGGTANLYLRLLGPNFDVVPLLGPRSPAQFEVRENELLACGTWQACRFTVRLSLAASMPVWFWHIELENCSDQPIQYDLIYAQDLGLAHYDFIRTNEFFCSHYLDHTALTHAARGHVLATRQNLSVDGNNPWTVLGSLGCATSYATDALQVYGLETRAGLLARGLKLGLPGQRHQHEHALIAVQDAVLALAPGETARRGFFGRFVPHHPSATGVDDLRLVDELLDLPEAQIQSRATLAAAVTSNATLFSHAPLFAVTPLGNTEIARYFGTRHDEEYDHGQLLAFFTADNAHVVLKSKELQVLRPHAQILRSGYSLVPDEASLTTTIWMAGGFNSLLTQGHVAINRLLSSARSYLSLFRAHGQRIFVESATGWELLDVPSAFVMTHDAGRWIYQQGETAISITTTALTTAHRIELRIDILNGAPRRFLLSHHVALNDDDGAAAQPVHTSRVDDEIQVSAAPDSEVGRRFPTGYFSLTRVAGAALECVGGDELLFTDGHSRAQPYLCLVTAPAREFTLAIEGHLIASTTADTGAARLQTALRLALPAAGAAATEIARWSTVLPWFVDNALVHYLAPRGLEQFTGGGWGSRDICQGPLEMLLALGQWTAARDLLTRVFEAQNSHGDWPQWFTFFARERLLRAGDSHGDIIFWPLLGLARYLESAEDAQFLDEVLPFFHAEEEAEHVTVWAHVERALHAIDTQMIAGTALVAYGHGDWNDSMQPADPAFRDRLCSSWTVTLHYQALTRLSAALERFGQSARAAPLVATAARVREAFQRLLVVDGLIAGYAHFEPSGEIEYLLHPRDKKTSLRYSLLPMPHALLTNLLDPKAASDHFDCITQHLLAADGARLFDQPMQYRGGPQQLFQRAETAAFFGREIGLMYTHAHLRYVEALAHCGRVEAFFTELNKVNPVGICERIKAATRRQANCYYSSSDAAFSDRYTAFTDYAQVSAGEIPLDGGWRVYSSGPGLTVSLVLRCLLGLQVAKTLLRFDPVLPKALDGLEAELELVGRQSLVRYTVEANGVGPLEVMLNGVSLPFQRLSNPYRVGGVAITLDTIVPHLRVGLNHWSITLA